MASYRANTLFVSVLAAMFAAGAPVVAATLEENREVMRKVIQRMAKDDENLSKFLFVRRREVAEIDSDGKVKSKSSVTTRLEAHDNVAVSRVIARNDKPLSADEIKRQDEKVKANVAEARGRNAASRKPSNRPKTDSDEELLMREFPEAIDFKLIGTESVRGRQADVYEFGPRPGYTPKTMKSRVFEKLRGKSWIDKASNELVRVEAEIFDTVGFGFGVLGKVGKGTRFEMERHEGAPGIWITHSYHVKFEARVLLVKNFRQEIDMRFSEFQLRPWKQEQKISSN